MTKTMRDAFLSALYNEMKQNDKIFLITADFGAPMLDIIREDCKNQVLNVGIAEQNAINIACGLGLEGYIVYVYGIAPFITMRAYEQIRINLAALSALRKMNINIIGVGAGVSYAMSGPTHHCLEDLGIMKTLPNIEVFSPSDSNLAEHYVKRTLQLKKPKYIRLDAQSLANLSGDIDFKRGFRILQDKGAKVAVITTGFMSQKAYSLAKNYEINLIDLFLLNAYDKEKLLQEINGAETIITAEEGFKNSGGLDSEINTLCNESIKSINSINWGGAKCRIINLGFPRKYTFDIGDREFIHSLNGLGINDLRLVFESLL